ncbi:site-specific DNA-methyltransferase [Candidatus Parabeggiatoa sp. HSG14]|uniref:DNA-methyltransferase n=1 Tax=Candidatus Parabeggiatoa sp. HSG14 TaxID=3055593 RepID=UPI0025A7599B|nr:site-specific DNA-methyltransferase [Thiotrichales bacterium HSG14]
MTKHNAIQGDCLDIAKKIKAHSVNLVYLDPPFFTQKKQRLKKRDQKEFSYDDLWESHQEYAEFIFKRLSEFHRLLANDGSIFVHCDKNATHIIRAMLDKVFGEENFRSEIIWYYKRWSNSKKGLLPAHQTIYFYSKTDGFKFNTIYGHYSESTNIDQILQKRSRDNDGKSVYATDKNGNVISADSKKGVPLSDVWEIPYLNPKAKERIGYPTQKPILLLERIIEIASHPCDLILDPFCGSGTTLVAAKLLGRNAIGIDTSSDAISLTKERLANPIKTDSLLLKKGRQAYVNTDEKALSIIAGLNIIPVQRNRGIDALLKSNYQGKPVPIRVQRDHESLFDAMTMLNHAAKNKGAIKAILIRTEENSLFHKELTIPDNIVIVDSAAYAINKKMR